MNTESATPNNFLITNCISFRFQTTPVLGNFGNRHTKTLSSLEWRTGRKTASCEEPRSKKYSLGYLFCQVTGRHIRQVFSHVVTKLHHATFVSFDLHQMKGDVPAEPLEKWHSVADQDW